MSEDTATEGAPTRASSDPRPGVRRRPKHRGVGLKVVRGRVARGGRSEASSGRRAVLALVGAVLPLPLLVVGGLVLDGTLVLPGRAGPPHVETSPAAHGGDEAHGAPGALAPGHGEAVAHGQAQGHPAGAAQGRDEGQGHPTGAAHGRDEGQDHPTGAAHGQGQGHPADASGHGAAVAPGQAREQHHPTSAPHADGHPQPARVPDRGALHAASGLPAQPPTHDELGSEGSGDGPSHVGANGHRPASRLDGLWAELAAWWEGEPAGKRRPPRAGLAASDPQAGKHAPAPRHGGVAVPAQGAGGHEAHEAPLAAEGAGGAAAHATPGAPDAHAGHEEPVNAPASHGVPSEVAPPPVAAPGTGEPSARTVLPRPRPRPTSPPPSLGARAAALLAGVWLSAGKPVASPTGAAPATARPDAVAARRVARQAAQVSMRLQVKLRRGSGGVWAYRSPDGLARVLLASLPDGGSKLLLTVDMAFVTGDPDVRRRLPRSEQLPGGALEAFLERFPSEGLDGWLRERPGFTLVDAFVATYMPPGRGTSSVARFEWWASLLRGRLEASRRPAGEEDIWTPTFNVGARVGQAFLAGQDFTLQLYIPPEDPGL